MAALDPIFSPEDWTQRLCMEELFPDSEQVSRPLAVDVGCGKGRYLLAAAQRHPHMTFLGIDRMRSRIHKLARKVERHNLNHVRLLQVEAAYAIRHLIPRDHVAVFTVFFPDPWPKRRHHRRRLFNAAFLDDLDAALAPDGCIHIATDHLDYFEAICTLFEADNRFKTIPPFEPTEDEQTDFERIFIAQGKPIGRASYALARSHT